MNAQKLLIGFTLLLFAFIGIKAVQKKKSDSATPEPQTIEVLVSLEDEPQEPQAIVPRSADGLPSANRIALLFNIGEPKLPFVETIRYSSRASWQPGRAAWVADYARHFETSRHFIARSLNGRADYLNQKVNNGDHFNVLRNDRDLSFYLVVDITRSTLWFYAHDGVRDEHTLLKSYQVGLGRPDENKTSGLLTPLGSYSLGDRIATYQPGRMGTFNGEPTEMIRVFGTRWIPFEKALANATEPARGFGLHGVPWEFDEASGELTERPSCLGEYESDGCIRLATQDIEELFAIIVTKPTTIEIVRDFHEARLPGREAEL